MDLFDDIIRDIAEKLRAAGTVRLKKPPAAWKDAGEHHMILAREMAYELGGSGTLGLGGCLATTGALPFSAGVYLCGEDLAQIKKDRSFARVVFLQLDEDAAGTGAGQDDLYRKLQEIDRVRYQVHPEGFMARISPLRQREPVRIAKKALGQQMCFGGIGQMYLERYQQIAGVRNVNVIFITDVRFDHAALDGLLRRADQIVQSLYHIFDGLRMDCGACGLKQICDEVEGLRELHFGLAGGEQL